MDSVHYIALLWGFTLIVVCFSLLTKPKHLKNIFVAAENETALLFLGILTVVIGMASVLVYNTFDHSWKTTITVLGWLTILKGLFYLFMPETTVVWVEKWKKSYMTWMPLGLMLGVLFGCVLVYFGLTF